MLSVREAHVADNIASCQGMNEHMDVCMYLYNIYKQSTHMFHKMTSSKAASVKMEKS